MAHEHIWRRIEKLRHTLAEQESDALLLLVTESYNWEGVYYLSGFRGSSSAVIVTREEAFLVTDSRYLAQARQQSPFDIVDQGNSKILETVAELLRKTGVGKAGFEGDRLSFSTYRKLADMSIRWVDMSEAVPAIRRRKDAGEIRLLEEAARKAEQAFHMTLRHAAPGMTERRFAALLEFMMREAGAEGGWGGDFIVASGPRSALPHGRASDRTIERGEWATIDFGARFGGYVSDITRNICFGPLDPWAKDLQDLLIAAHTAGERALRPGIQGLAVDAASRAVIRDAGYGDQFSHGLGHGIGLEVHEAPRLSFKSADDVLSVGDVVTVEPGVYFEGRGGMRIEDDYVLTETGAARLTTGIPREVIVL